VINHPRIILSQKRDHPMKGIFGDYEVVGEGRSMRNGLRVNPNFCVCADKNVVIVGYHASENALQV
jgi:hypothetical protein